MAELKTQPNDASIDAFLATIDNADRVEDCRAVMALMREVTGEEPRMWGGSIIGFGQYHYRYESGQEGDWFLTGVSPRKNALTVYIVAGFDRYPDLMATLGAYRTGRSCLYLKRLADVDVAVLRELIDRSTRQMAASHAR